MSKGIWSVISVFVSTLMACQTTAPTRETFRDEIMGLEGMSFDYIKTQWGEPDETADKGKKATVKYGRVMIHDEDFLTGSNIDRVCSVRLEIDDEKLVTDWDYEDCQQRSNVADKSLEPSSPSENLESQGQDTAQEDAGEIEKTSDLPQDEASDETAMSDQDDSKQDGDQKETKDEEVSSERKIEMIPLVE